MEYDVDNDGIPEFVVPTNDPLTTQGLDSTSVVIPELSLLRTGGVLKNSSVMAAMMFLVAGVMLGGVSLSSLKK
ncbi:hypothetical protein HC766_05585 [Candidatus Gracilibacteria bacterium]|nr:hypothetical protein [Candidatus Gracilibacteria bacterium]